MKFPNLIRNKEGRLSKHQREAYFQNMDSLIANLAVEDQGKMEYVKCFIDRLPITVLEDGDTITLGPMDYKLFQYMLYWLILEYDTSSNKEKVKLQT